MEREMKRVEFVVRNGQRMDMGSGVTVQSVTYT
jgi:hypothetical protein